MALEDLIIDHKQISKELVEKVLKRRVELIKDSQGVLITKAGNNFSSKIKVLLLLCGKKAWSLLTSGDILTSIDEIEKNVGIKGNTLRPLLKDLKDSYMVESEKGKYKILPKGIFELENEFEHKIANTENKEVMKNQIQKTPQKDFSRSESINKLYEQGFFKEPKTLEDIRNQLEKMGIITKPSSLPSYILPLVRKEKLFREKIEKNKKKIWIYKLP